MVRTVSLLGEAAKFKICFLSLASPGLNLEYHPLQTQIKAWWWLIGQVQ
jgi:hypothetical protein